MAISRTKKLAYNTIYSVILQITTVVCGLILPRLILGEYGSEVNGLVNSITQFLGIISLLDLGVGAVVQSALYKPLAEKNNEQISKIYVSAKKFFNKLAIILLIYIVFLSIFYPKFSNSSFSFKYIDALIIAISITSFAQYYFGIVNSLVLNADQKGYIQYIITIITLILNIIACYFLIKAKFSIQFVKLVTSVIFLLRPLFMEIYIKKNYTINKKIKYDEEPVKQKWNGMAQHFSHVVLTNTDTIVLTIFSTLTNVSIYAVYNYVILGVKNAMLSFTKGFLSLMGDLYAKKEFDKLRKFFDYIEWLLHTMTTLIFGCTGILIINFVKVYTKGINDADYIQPLFGILITLANAGHCLSLPYNNLTKAAGHYKQTQGNYITTMLINIIISILTVKAWGLIGVSIGTLVAMFYQTIWMAWYTSKNIIEWPLKKFWKQLITDCIIVIIGVLLTFKIPMLNINYKSWILLAIEIFAIWTTIEIIINLIFNKEKVKYLLNIIKNKIKK